MDFIRIYCYEVNAVCPIILSGFSVSTAGLSTDPCLLHSHCSDDALSPSSTSCRSRDDALLVPLSAARPRGWERAAASCTDGRQPSRCPIMALVHGTISQQMYQNSLPGRIYTSLIFLPNSGRRQLSVQQNPPCKARRVNTWPSAARHA